jgi:phenylacetate-coenzyme A ligase PaaK-like adenylate-forming protein
VSSAPTAPPVPLLETIFELIPRLNWSPTELAEHRRRELGVTLRCALQRSRWHHERLAPFDLSAIGPDDLGALPTMTKRDLMANWDDIVTNPRLTLASARAYLDDVDSHGLQPWHGEYLVFASGGSTGEPGVFCWSLAEMARWGASSIRWSLAAGVAPPKRHAWVGARSLRHPSAVAAILTGGTPDLIVGVDRPVAEIVERLNTLQPDALSVVCSMLPPLVDAAVNGELLIAVDRVSVFGDVLDRTAVAEAARVFGTEPLESYPTTDCGYIAQQAPGEPGLYLNDDLLVVEPVDADDQPVERGQMTDHLLVTSLHQRTLPLIRYRIDDRVTFDQVPGRYPHYQRITGIDGRSDDVFHYGEVTVHPHVFRSVLSRHLEVRDYAVHQVERGAVVQIQATAAFDTEGLAAELCLALARAGLLGPDVSVSVVDALERTAVGKRRHFIAA